MPYYPYGGDYYPYYGYDTGQPYYGYDTGQPYYGYGTGQPYNGYGTGQPSTSQSWYYCSDPAGYYPYVTQCNTGWQTVPAS